MTHIQNPCTDIYESEKYISIDIHTYFIAQKGKNTHCLIVAIMKFELLQNEILIECFEYLNGPDIFLFI
jgi:hypothetical protein